MKALPLLFLLSSCTTIHPRISCVSFDACKKLCKKQGGIESVQSDIDLNYFGKVFIASETCICKNSTAFLIAPRQK